MATSVSADKERHASSLIVALDIYPQMAIQMIHKCSPNTVFMMIQNDPNNKFMKSLNNSEKKLIPTLNTDEFNKLDLSLLYKLIRRFKLVREPSKKWGNRPSDTNINQGDDIERMRNNRNELFHRPKGGLSEEERDKFFKESIEIACRVDNFIGESTSSFETRIRNAKIYHITQEQCRQALEECVELQQQLKDISGINHVDLYYGDDIAVKLGNQDLPATNSTRCSVYIRDPKMDVPAIIEKLEEVKKRLNEGSYEIKLLKAETGSLVLHVEINNICFKAKDSLHKAIAEFLRRMFTSISGSLDQHIMEVVLVDCDSYTISDNEDENDEYLNDQEPSILKLDVMVRNTALQSKTDLYRDVHGFISKVLDVTDKNVESTNGSPFGVIMTSQHVDERVFPKMQELFYIDPKDSLATMSMVLHRYKPTIVWSWDEGRFVVADMEGITDLHPMTGVCDWSHWSSVIAPKVTSGPSLLHTPLSHLMENGYSVVCGIQVENWTKYPFSNPMTTLQWGHLSCPGTTVQPATREAMVGHKYGYTATGTSGTASWLINGSDRRLVVMWSAPFNFDIYSNYMAFGFTKKGCKIHDKNWFQTMYYDKNIDMKSEGTPRMNFKRMECRNTCEEIIVEDDIFEMSGTMGTNHHPVIKIIVKPKHWENLARNLQVTI